MVTNCDEDIINSINYLVDNDVYNQSLNTHALELSPIFSFLLDIGMTNESLEKLAQEIYTTLKHKLINYELFEKLKSILRKSYYEFSENYKPKIENLKVNIELDINI